ncbi:hypothetical protein ABW20_dc0107517 [Dactylellina cionopaga]|nr:hypothetical protein ABW20_dc0107517 [Dactylellina cionopaga]
MARKNAPINKTASVGGLEPDDTNVLVLQLGCQTEAEVIEFRHGEFLELIKEHLGMTLITDARTASDFIKQHGPSFIVVIDGAFAKRDHRWLQDEVVETIKNGAALIFCCEFPRTVSSHDFKYMILNAFNLSWEPGLIRSGTYSLHKACDVLTGIHHAPGIEVDLEMSAVQIWDIEDDARLYINKELDQGEEKGKDCAATVFQKYENGYVCYVGDLDTTPVMRNVILNFMTKANMKFSNPMKHRGSYKQRDHGPPAQSLHRFKKRERNTTPLNHRGPCGTCGNPATNRTCNLCKTVFYCSSNCQNMALKKHKDFCPASRIPLGEAIKLAVQGNATPLVKELISTQDRREVLERLIDTYRLRVEDLYHVSGINAGYYKNPGSKDLCMEEFVNFLCQLQGSRQIVRPEWWDLASQTDCEDLARNHILRFYIGNPITDHEIATHYGNPVMPSALRTLGDILYGEKVPQRPVSRGLGNQENSGQEGVSAAIAPEDTPLGNPGSLGPEGYDTEELEAEITAGLEAQETMLNERKDSDPKKAVIQFGMDA